MFTQYIKNTQTPSLKEGDKVEFELSSDGQKNTPRWDMNVDTGSTGSWADGFVVKIDDEIILVEFTIKDYIGAGHCEFPNVKHPAYIPQQWMRAGYLRKTKQVIIPNCDCGGEKTYGKNSNLHSGWCSLYSYMNKKKLLNGFKI